MGRFCKTHLPERTTEELKGFIRLQQGRQLTQYQKDRLKQAEELLNGRTGTGDPEAGRVALEGPLRGSGAEIT
jgi:hypothetical protein